MSMLTSDLREEGRSLYTLLKLQPDAFWTAKTAFKGWTTWDVIAHLHFSDHMAMTTARSEDEFAALMNDVMAQIQAGKGLQQYACDWLGEICGPALLERWYVLFGVMCDLFDAQPEGARLKWFGPDMGIRMFATARQMETWAHGQELYDLLAVERENTDRIKNIVVIGVKTFAFAHKNRGLPVPDAVPYIALTSPSGKVWEFGDTDLANIVSGSAVEFAQVVTQTRNVADTNLVVRGDIAQNWMKIVQCFAGAPEEPPVPGARFISKTPMMF